MNDTPRQPPRFVPVLTEVVDADQRPAPQPSAPALAPMPAPGSSSPQTLQDQLIHRVMQRVDVALDQQLHDAVASMVLQHTHALLPRLREEIELVVREAVVQAVAAELAQRSPA